MKRIFKDVIQFLLTEQESQPLEELIFYPFHSHGIEQIDPHDLYRILEKIKSDYNQLIQIYTPPLFDSEEPYPDIGVEINNMWSVKLPKTFPAWARKYLNGTSEQDFKIESFNFGKDGVLSLNDKHYKFSSEKNLYYIVKYLFKNKTNLRKTVDAFVITDLGSESPNGLYWTGRHLNTKLCNKLPISDLIKYDSQKIFINPQYIR